MRELFRFSTQVIGFFVALMFGNFSHADFSNQDTEISHSPNEKNALTSIDIDVRSQAEINHLFLVIRALELSAELVDYSGSTMTFKLPQNQKVMLAGQIWLAK